MKTRSWASIWKWGQRIGFLGALGFLGVSFSGEGGLWGTGLVARASASEDPVVKAGPGDYPDPSWEKVSTIFLARCNSCHEDAKKRGGLTLQSAAGFHKGGDSGPARDEILKRIALPADAEGAMPPKGARVTPEEMAVLKAHLGQIRQPKVDEVHWSLKKVTRPLVPSLKPGSEKNGDGTTPIRLNPVDHFLRAKLSEAGLKSNGEADKRTLLRRLKFDLLGLPPTPQEVAEFEADPSAGAYEKRVEAYLASPQFGERWARHWLDVVRFAESDGFETNQPRPNAWVYRDWVIKAFQTDMPYNRFLEAQLAGDQIGEPEGTGFLVGGPWDRVKSPDETLIRQQRADELHDMVSTATSAFLGLTGGCARCHSHKFDPISQEDYYRIKAIFEGVIHGERAIPANPAKGQEIEILQKEIRSIEKELAGFERSAHSGETVWLYPTLGASETYVNLVKPMGIEPYTQGSGPGQRSFAGNGEEYPTLGKGYAYWSKVKNQPVALYKPRVDGSYLIGFSWGAGWNTHTSKARLVLDRDGKPETTGDQTTVATLDQQQRASGRSTPPNQPLWSGLADLGQVELTRESALIVYAGPDDAYVTADLMVLQKVIEKTNGVSQKVSLRSPVVTGENRERFGPVKADRVRIRIARATQSEPCLDEVEIFSPEEPGVNLARRDCKVTASSTYPNNAFHKLEHINDGIYGNSKSWISGTVQNSWVEFRLAKPALVNEIRWSRDRSAVPQFSDRIMADYAIEVANGNDAWKDVAGSKDRVAPGIPDGLALRFAPGNKQNRVLSEKTEKLAQLRQRASVISGQRTGYLGQFQQPGKTYLLHRGDPMSPKQSIGPGAFTKIGDPINLHADAPEAQRRMALAKWFTSPANPLPARVMVNRLWQYHFGMGIVATASDFGRNGARPTHPELLDWLASELVEPQVILPGEAKTSPWSLKHIHRLIVTSAAYRQSSAGNDEGMAKDAQSRLLWRYPSRRLEAESIRDAILFVSGNLSLEQGGPGFDLFEPNTNYVKVYVSKSQFGPAEWRRMVYQNKPRMRLDNIFGGFDCPDAGQIAPARNRSTTPLQSLALLNSPFMLDQSARLAKRVEKESGPDPRQQIRKAFSLAFQRLPDEREEAGALDLVAKGQLVSLCRALLASNEFLYPD